MSARDQDRYVVKVGDQFVCLDPDTGEARYFLSTERAKALVVGNVFAANLLVAMAALRMSIHNARVVRLTSRKKQSNNKG